MADIIGFDNMDDMFRFLEFQEQNAVNQTSIPQWILCDGGEHWFYRAVEFGGQLLAIFGHIETLDANIAAERKYYSAVMDADEQAEFDEIQNNLATSLTRGFAYGRHYSIVEPEGELGKTHVSQVLPIRQETFLSAQRAGWSMPKLSEGDGYQELLKDVRDFMEATKS